jgi:hypothetical protein
MWIYGAKTVHIAKGCILFTFSVPYCSFLVTQMKNRTLAGHLADGVPEGDCPVFYDFGIDAPQSHVLSGFGADKLQGVYSVSFFEVGASIMRYFRDF